MVESKMSNYRQDPEAVFRIPTTTTDQREPLEIRIAKVGGGTVGKSYDGRWFVDFYVYDALMLSEDGLGTGTSATHEEAAKIYAGILAGWGDPDSGSGEYIPWLRMFVERLDAFANGLLAD